MKKIKIVIVLLFLATQLFAQKNVGIGNSSPITKLDVSGAIALREGAAITVTSPGAHGGANDNIALPDISGTTDVASFYHITTFTGTAGAFSIYGIAPNTGANGQVVTLVNATGKVMTLVNNNSSTAANSIYTPTGANLVDNASSGVTSSITLQYSLTAGGTGNPGWLVTATQNYIVAAGTLVTNNVLAGSSSNSVSITNGTGQVVGGSNLTVNVAKNALGQDGVVPGTATPTNNNQVWGTNGSGVPAWGSVTNAQLANSAITVNAGTGVSVTGSPVSLGGTITLANTGVTSVTASNGLTSSGGATPNITLGGTLTGTTTINTTNGYNLDLNTGSTANPTGAGGSYVGNIVLGANDGSTTLAPYGGVIRGPNAGFGNTNGGNLVLDGGYAFGAATGGGVYINGGTTSTGGTEGGVYLRGGYNSGIGEGTVYLNDDNAGIVKIGGPLTLSNTTYTSAGGLLKATASTGAVTIAAAGSDYQAPLTFNNGLTLTGTTATLGGNLLANTSIALNNGGTNYNLTLNTNSTTNSTGAAYYTGGNIIIGTGDGGAPYGGVVRGPNAGNSNTAGGNLVFDAGWGTGTAAGGSVFVNGGTTGTGSNGNVYLRGGYSNSAEGAVYINDDHGGPTFINTTGGGTITLGSGTGVAYLSSGVLGTATAAQLGGYWSRSGTTLTTANAGDNVTINGTGTFKATASGNNFVYIDNSTAGAQSGFDFNVNGTTRTNLYFDPTSTWGTNGGLMINNYGTNTPNVIVNTSGGNLGVNTTGVPAQALSVGGTTGNFLVTSAGVVSTSNTTASSTTSTGALIVTGGEGLGGNLNVGGTETVTGLATLNGGLTETGIVNINASANNATNINTGSSTGTVTIGNSANKINTPGLTASSAVYTDASSNLTTSVPNNSTLGYWTRNNASSYLYNTTLGDNVGVGTSTPGYKLDVAGEGRFTANGGGSVSAIIAAGSTGPSIAWDLSANGTDQKWWDMVESGTTLLGRTVNDANSAATVWLQVNRGSGYTMSSVTFPNGNVGIGLTSPLVLLDVDGNALIRGANTNTPATPASAMEFLTGRSNSGALVSGQTNADIAFQYGGGGYRHFIQTRHNSTISTAGGNDIDFYLNNSTSSTGSVDPSGLTANGNLQVMTLANYNGIPAVGIGTSSPAYPLQINYNNGSTIGLAQAALVINNTNSSGQSMIYFVTGSSSKTASIRADVGSNMVLNASSGNFYLDDDFGGAPTILAGGGSSTLGITASSVNMSGAASIAGNLSEINGLSYTWPTTQGTAGQVLTNAGSGTLSWAGGSGTGASGYWTRTGTILYNTNTGDYVGIGTSSPQVGLDVETALSATYGRFGSTNPVYFVANEPMVGFNILWNGGYTYGPGGGYGGMINFNQEVSGGFNVLTAGSGSANGSATMSSRLSITNAGNVGIGTTSPAYSLQVTGSGSSNVNFFVNGRMQTGDGNNNGGVWLSSSNNMFVGQTGTNVGFWTATAGWNAFQVTQAGNASVGTTPSGNYKIFGYDGSGTSGTGYATSIYAGTFGEAGAGSANYSFGVGGYQIGSGTRSGGVHGAYSTATWGVLGYDNSGGSTYGVYYTSYSSGGGFLPQGNQRAGIGAGGTGDFIGSWTRGGVIGHMAAGELAAGYNVGNVYTSGHNVEIVDNGEERVAAYSSTSIQASINTSGKGQLSGGKATVSFDAKFISMLSKDEDPIVTITPVGNCNGIHLVSVSDKGFEVEENNGGNSNVIFTYIVMGKRVDAASATLPGDFADKNFDENLKGFMFNEADQEHNAKPMWWDGSKIQFSTIPTSLTEKKDVNGTAVPKK